MFQRLWNKIKALFSVIGDFLSSFFSAEVQIVDNVNRIVTNFDLLKANIPIEIERLKNFKFDPKWSTRVINVPIAIDQVRELIDKFTTGWKEKFETIEAPIHEFSLIFHAEQNPDPQQPSALSRTAVKVDQIATLIAQLADASDQIVEIADMFDELRQQIETLDAVFLQQGNSRQYIRGVTRKRIPR